MRCSLLVSAVVSALLIGPSTAYATAVSIDFESYSDLDPVGSISGATFVSATVLTSGASGGTLNEADFPPRSGINVAADIEDFANGVGGPMRISFASTVLAFSGYFTYNTSLLLEAFDASSNLVVSVASLFANNTATAGDAGSTPNELLAIAAANIASVRITGDAAGFSFTVDDILFEPSPANGTEVPEPSTVIYVATAAAVAVRKRLKHSMT